MMGCRIRESHAQGMKCYVVILFYKPMPEPAFSRGIPRAWLFIIFQLYLLTKRNTSRSEASAM